MRVSQTMLRLQILQVISVSSQVWNEQKHGDDFVSSYRRLTSSSWRLLSLPCYPISQGASVQIPLPKRTSHIFRSGVMWCYRNSQHRHKSSAVQIDPIFAPATMFRLLFCCHHFAVALFQCSSNSHPLEGNSGLRHLYGLK